MGEKKQERFTIELESHPKLFCVVRVFDQAINRGAIIASCVFNRPVLELDIHVRFVSAGLDFFKTFNRSMGEELVIRAVEWGQKQGATHINPEIIDELDGKRAFKRDTARGWFTEYGKILKVPEPLDLKAIQLEEKPKPPKLPRKPLAKRPRRKPSRKPPTHRPK